jgi:hypothetical protein
MKDEQTTFENFGVNIPKVRKKKKVIPPTPSFPMESQEPEIDYEEIKRKSLAKNHLCFGSTTVYLVGEKVLGTGDLRYYDEPLWGKNLMVRDIFHNFHVLRKMLLDSKFTQIGKSYDADIYEYKATKKEIQKRLQEDCNNGHSVYEITETSILDYPFVAEKTMTVEWNTLA